MPSFIEVMLFAAFLCLQLFAHSLLNSEYGYGSNLTFLVVSKKELILSTRSNFHNGILLAAILFDIFFGKGGSEIFNAAYVVFNIKNVHVYIDDNHKSADK